MKCFDSSWRQRATRPTFLERTLARFVEKRAKHAELLVRPQQLIAASRKLLSEQAPRAFRELASNIDDLNVDMAQPGSAECETGQWRWNGRPDALERSAWHWVEDGDGLRPMLWHGEDWPAAPSRGIWQDGFASLSPDDLSHAHYHGPLTMPAGSAVSDQNATDQGR